MFKLDKKPETLIEAVDIFIFLSTNNNSRLVYGTYSIKRSLNDLAKQFPNAKLSDKKEINEVLQKFMSTRNLMTYNERCLGLKALYNWLMDCNYVDYDPTRIYLEM